MRQGFIKWVLPFIILAFGIAVFLGLVMTKEEPPKTEFVPEPPFVKQAVAELDSSRQIIRSQGTVEPGQEIKLVSEVSGKVMKVSENFVVGGIFKKNDPLIWIDRADYELALAQAEARVAEAEQRVMTWEAESLLAQKDWERFGEGEASPLTLKIPQLKEAKASLLAAQAELKKAQRDLERTEIKAPFAGTIREKMVDVGQVISMNERVGEIYSTHFVEVRLPIDDDMLAFIETENLKANSPEKKTEVKLTARYAGKMRAWTGFLDRIEGEMDAKTRLINVIARVAGESQPLPGLFVEAEITGQILDKVVRIPRTSLKGSGQVWVITKGSKLEIRDVDIVRRGPEHIWISHGLKEGEIVVASHLGYVTPGMQVKVMDQEVGT